MNSFATIASSHLLPVLFVYGLSFFVLGLLVFSQHIAGSSFKLRRFIWLFGAFGLMHGMSEWADMFVSLGDNYWTVRGADIIQVIGFYLALGSFVFLLEFGVRLAWLHNDASRKLVERYTLGGSALFIVFVLVYQFTAKSTDEWALNSNILMRYLLAVPASLLTAIGFFRKSKFEDVADLAGGRIRRNMATMGLCFAAYGVFAGLIVPKGSFFPASVLNYSTFTQLLGVPVQLLRAACAIWAALLIYPILSMFMLESTLSLESALTTAHDLRDSLESKVAERTSELETANRELKSQVEERTRLEGESKRAREEAEEATRAKSEFLANMSHEIRTPLNGVMGMVDLSLDTELTAEQRSYLETAKSSADSLLGVINDILDFSKIEARQLELDRADFPLRETIGEAISILGLRAEQKGLELACRIAPDVHDDLVGDPGRLRQIILNLTGNAIKFTQKGEVIVNVRTESRSEAEATLRFSVTDTGIGIPKEKQAAVFEAFRQADNSTTRTYGGTGLGLTISSQLVQLMGGHLWVESESGKGSTFHFTATFGVSKSAVVRPALRTLIGLENLPVLVIDDNATNRQIVQEMLVHWHMKPTSAPDGFTALRALNDAKQSGTAYRLIILDRNMPEMDGFALVEQIRLNPALMSASIMMLSSSGKEGDRQRCRELGVSAYLTKPVQQSALLNAIVMAMDKSSMEEVIPVAEEQVATFPEGLQVLLAEDNPVNQKLAVRLLEKRGCRVQVASTGREVLAALRKGSFDIVLMDLQMPEMDGFETTAAIRQGETITHQHLLIMALTAHAMKGDLERCLAAGMDGYLTKPIEGKSLYAEIKRLLVGSPQMASLSFDSPLLAPFDEEALRQRLDYDDSLLSELVDLFQNDYARVLEGIRSTIDSNDSRALERAAHFMKGMVTTFGAKPATGAAAILESMGREGRTDQCMDAFASLEIEINRLQFALADFVERTSP